MTKPMPNTMQKTRWGNGGAMVGQCGAMVGQWEKDRTNKEKTSEVFKTSEVWRLLIRDYIQIAVGFISTLGYLGTISVRD